MKSNRRYYHILNNQKDLLIPSVFLSYKSNDMLCLSSYFTSKNGNIDALEKTFNVILRDNDALRIRLKTNVKGIKQYFDDYQYVKVPIIEIENEDKLEEEMREHRRFQKFLFGGSLCNAYIFKYDNKATILINAHHFVCDGLGLSILMSNFITIYSGLVNGSYKNEIDSNISTFEQFVKENEHISKTKNYTRSKKYYRDKFNSNKNLKIIGPIMKTKSTVDIDTYFMDREDYQKVVAYSENIGIPISFFITCMIGKTLSHITGHNDICLYYLNHGRTRAAYKKTIGNMVGSCMFFFHNDDNQKCIDMLKENYIDYLQSVKHGNLMAFDYIFCGFRHSLKIMRLNYFNVMISCLNYRSNDKSDNDLLGGVVNYKYQPSSFYCTIENYEKEMHITLTYHSKIISKEKLQKIKDELTNCIIHAINER